MIEYVRCHYCDSTIGIDDITDLIKLPMKEGSKHVPCLFTCPACGFNQHGYIFKEDDDYAKSSTMS